MNEKVDKEQVISTADIYIPRHRNEGVSDVRAGRP